MRFDNTVLFECNFKCMCMCVFCFVVYYICIVSFEAQRILINISIYKFMLRLNEIFRSNVLIFTRRNFFKKKKNHGTQKNLCTICI